MRAALHRSACRRSARAAQRGFTLLEVMAASAIMTIFLMAIYVLVFGMLRQRQTIEENTLPYAQGPIAIDRIAEDLRYALIEPYKNENAFSLKGETVGGEEVSEVQFVSVVRSRSKIKVDEDLVGSAICELGYRTRRSETRDGLLALYRREDFGVDDEPLDGGRYYKLLDGVRVFRVDVFKSDPGSPDEEDAEGESDWEAKDEKRLPWGARITLIIEAPVELDDRGDPIEDPRVFEFVRYIAFANRFDFEGANSAPAGNQPGGNQPGGNQPEGQ